MTVQAWVGVGANLGNPVSAVRDALAALGRLETCRLLGQSALYRTTPIGPGVEGQPDYINAAALLETSLTAQALLAALFDIEEQFGRQRGARNAARTLDLDLLLYGDSLIHEANLVVPHPRMHERAFVLCPMAELAPDTLIPGHGTVQMLLAQLDDQGIQQLNE